MTFEADLAQLLRVVAVVGRRVVAGWRSSVVERGYDEAAASEEAFSLQFANELIGAAAASSGKQVKQLLASDAAMRALYAKAYRQKQRDSGHFTEERKAAQRERDRRYQEKVREEHRRAREAWIAAGNTEEFILLENYRRKGRIPRAATPEEIAHARRAFHLEGTTVFGHERRVRDRACGTTT